MVRKSFFYFIVLKTYTRTHQRIQEVNDNIITKQNEAQIHNNHVRFLKEQESGSNRKPRTIIVLAPKNLAKTSDNYKCLLRECHSTSESEWVINLEMRENNDNFIADSIITQQTSPSLYDYSIIKHLYSEIELFLKFSMLKNCNKILDYLKQNFGSSNGDTSIKYDEYSSNQLQIEELIDNKKTKSENKNLFGNQIKAIFNIKEDKIKDMNVMISDRFIEIKHYCRDFYYLLEIKREE